MVSIVFYTLLQFFQICRFLQSHHPRFGTPYIPHLPVSACRKHQRTISVSRLGLSFLSIEKIHPVSGNSSFFLLPSTHLLLPALAILGTLLPWSYSRRVDSIVF